MVENTATIPMSEYNDLLRSRIKLQEISLTPLLRCERCGGKNVSIRLHLDYSRYHGANYVDGKVTGGS